MSFLKLYSLVYQGSSNPPSQEALKHDLSLIFVIWFLLSGWGFRRDFKWEHGTIWIFFSVGTMAQSPHWCFLHTNRSSTSRCQNPQQHQHLLNLWHRAQGEDRRHWIINTAKCTNSRIESKQLKFFSLRQNSKMLLGPVLPLSWASPRLIQDW